MSRDKSDYFFSVKEIYRVRIMEKITEQMTNEPKAKNAGKPIKAKKPKAVNVNVTNVSSAPEEDPLDKFKRRTGSVSDKIAGAGSAVARAGHGVIAALRGRF